MSCSLCLLIDAQAAETSADAMRVVAQSEDNFSNRTSVGRMSLRLPFTDYTYQDYFSDLPDGELENGWNVSTRPGDLPEHVMSIMRMATVFPKQTLDLKETFPRQHFFIHSYSFAPADHSGITTCKIVYCASFRYDGAFCGAQIAVQPGFAVTKEYSSCRIKALKRVIQAVQHRYHPDPETLPFRSVKDCITKLVRRFYYIIAPKPELFIFECNPWGYKI